MGNHISGAVTGSDATGGNDALKKSFDAVKEALLPHWAEESERKAQKVKKTLMEEVNRGPLKIKVVGKDKKSRRRD
ncbi:MAG: hypothetical protein EBZ49_00740 [Proteobacteria bacterium]|nr:hypothetical protein [Pseudomonadota bacterium]